MFDLSSNPADLKPPLGWVGLHVDNELVPRAVIEYVRARSLYTGPPSTPELL